MFLLLRSASVAGTEFKSGTDTAYLSVVEDSFDDFESSVYDPFSITLTEVASPSVNVSRGETTSLRLVEVSVLTTLGAIDIAGTDTASLTLTEVASAPAVADVTDTTSLTLTDSGAVDVYDNLVDGTDTTSLSLSDYATVDRRDYGLIDYADDDTLRLRLEDIGTVQAHNVVTGCRITFGEWKIRVTLH